MKRYKITVLLGCVLVLSCNKIEIPDPIVEQPVFKLDLNLENQTVSFGDRNNAMIPDYQLDPLGIRVFESKFISNIDDMERNNITFHLRDDRLFSQDDGDSLSIFRPGAYEYLSTPETTMPVKIMMNNLMNVMYHDKVTWIKGIEEQKGRYFHVYDVNEGQNLSVEMHIEDSAKGCFTTYTKQWTPNLGDVTVSGFEINGRTITPIIPNFTGSLTFEWNTTPTQKEKEIEIMESGRYCLTITNPPKGSTTICMNLEIENNSLKMPCFSGIESQLVQFNAPPEFSTAEVIWIDNDGREYSSKHTTQSDNTYFYILGSTPYNKLNHIGQKVKKVDVEFSCDLSTEDGDKVRIYSGEGTIGFSYY